MGSSTMLLRETASSCFFLFARGRSACTAGLVMEHGEPGAQLQMLQGLVEMLQCPASVGQQLLEACNWDMDSAVALFFVSQADMPGTFAPTSAPNSQPPSAPDRPHSADAASRLAAWNEDVEEERQQIRAGDKAKMDRL